MPAPEPLLRLGWDPDLAAAFADLSPDLTPGRIGRVDRGLSTVHGEHGQVRAATAGQRVAVGDWVGVGGDPPAVLAVLPRRTALVRQAAGDATVEQVLAANVDTVFVTVSLQNALNPRRLERSLTLAWSSGATPVVVLTKADACDDVDAAVLEVQETAVGVDVVATSGVTGFGLPALAPWIGARPDGSAPTVVVIGPSGAGKSTLVNALAGEEVMATQEVRAGDGKGRHTTVHRQLVPLPSGALLLDTPGLRGLGLWTTADAVDTAFPDIDELAEHCRFGDCAHRDEPGCAVTGAVEAGTLSAERLASWHKLQHELVVLAARRDKRLAAEERRRSLRTTRAYRDIARDRRER